MRTNNENRDNVHRQLSFRHFMGEKFKILETVRLRVINFAGGRVLTACHHDPTHRRAIEKWVLVPAQSEESERDVDNIYKDKRI